MMPRMTSTPQNPARLRHHRRDRPRHHGCRHRRGLRPQRLQRGRRRAERRGAGAWPPAPRALDRPRGEAGEDDRGGAAGAAGTDLVHHLDEGPGGRRLRGRGGRGVARGQEGDLPPARRHRRAGVDPGDQHLVPLGHRDLHRQQSARPGHRRPLLQPGAGPEPCRDRAHGRHRAAGARGRQGARQTSSARTPSSAATRRASSPTPCSSATSTTRSRCTRAATPPARTSTPRCGSAAATRWVRSRCST